MFFDPTFSFSYFRGDKCNSCPQETDNLMFAAAGVVAGIAGLVAFVLITLSDEGKINSSDGAKTIGLSFVQIISLLATYPISWPKIFVDIFKVGGAVAVLGQHFVNLKCMEVNKQRSEADLFFVTRIVWAIMPVFVPLCCVLLWLLVGWCKTVARLRIKMKASVVALLFLMWPGLSSETFALFSCRQVCGRTVLRVDLDEACWVGRHRFYALLVGVPMLLVYVIGLPSIALLNVWWLQRRARKEKVGVETYDTHVVWGIFYSAFDPRTWFWEMTVAARKILVALLGVFGGSMGKMQIHLTALLLVMVIVLTAVVRPFGEQSLLQFLELATLLATWMTVWAGSVFNEHPRCEGGEGVGVETLPWCNVLSVGVGSVDALMLLVVVVVVMFYMWQEKREAKKEREEKKGEQKEEEEKSAARDDEDVVAESYPLNTKQKKPAAKTKKKKKKRTAAAKAKAKKSKGGNEAAVAIEMASRDGTSEGVVAGQHQKLDSMGLLPEGWERHRTGEGKKYFANVGTGESIWERPKL